MISAVFSRQMVRLGPRYWLSPLPQPISGLWLRSMFWLLIALLELLLHAASSVQLYQGSVSFQCPSIEEQTLEIQADVKYGAVEDGVEIGASPTGISWRKPETKMVSLKPTFWTITRSKTPTNSQSWQKSKTKSQERHRIESICKIFSDQHPFKFPSRQICQICQVSGQLLTILLFFSIFLSSRAQWRICLEVTAGELRQLLGPQGGHGGGVVVPKTRHPVLSRVFGKELTELRGPWRPLPVEQPKMWGEETGNHWKIMGNGGKLGWFQTVFLNFLCWTGYFCLWFLDVFGGSYKCLGI